MRKFFFLVFFSMIGFMSAGLQGATACTLDSCQYRGQFTSEPMIDTELGEIELDLDNLGDCTSTTLSRYKKLQERLAHAKTCLYYTNYRRNTTSGRSFLWSSYDTNEKIETLHVQIDSRIEAFTESVARQRDPQDVTECTSTACPYRLLFSAPPEISGEMRQINNLASGYKPNRAWYSVTPADLEALKNRLKHTITCPYYENSNNFSSPPELKSFNYTRRKLVSFIDNQAHIYGFSLYSAPLEFVSHLTLVPGSTPGTEERMNAAFSELIEKDSLDAVEAFCHTLVSQSFTKDEIYLLLEAASQNSEVAWAQDWTDRKKNVVNISWWQDRMQSVDQALAAKNYALAEDRYWAAQGLVKGLMNEIVLLPHLKQYKDAFAQHKTEKRRNTIIAASAAAVLGGVALAGVARAHRQYSDNELKLLQWYRRYPVALARRLGIYRHQIGH